MSFPISLSQLVGLLERCIADLAADQENVEKAFLCVATAGHLPERLAYATGLRDKKKINAYRDGLELREPSLKLIRDLNNFAKHTAVTKYKADTLGLRTSDDVHAERYFMLLIDDEDLGTWANLNVRGFQVEIRNGTQVALIDVLRRAHAFLLTEIENQQSP